MPLIPRCKYFAAQPMEKSRALGFNSLESLKPFHHQKGKLGVDHHFVVAERGFSLSMARWRATEQDSGPQSSLHVRPAPLYVDGNRSSFQYKNDIFSSSFSEALNRELSLSSRDALSVRSVNNLSSNFEGDEPFESLEIEAQTIGSLLPDEDELLSGIIDDIECNSRPNRDVDAEDDLFSTGGGIELEADHSLICNNGLYPAIGVSTYGEMLSSPFSGAHPCIQRPSRTLFVRNISCEVEDYELRALFEQYGGIHTLYTASKHLGFVMISYYDIRSACNAMKALQNKSLGHRKLGIHFSAPKDNPLDMDINQGTLMVFNLDPSVSNDDLHQIFGVYGDIKEICENPHNHQHKSVEYYDVRAAEAALCALSKSDIAGKRIKREPSRPGGAGWCNMMQQLSPYLDQEEAKGGCQQGSPSNNSPLGDYGSSKLGVARFYGHDNGSFQGVLPTDCAPHHQLVETKFGEISSNISNNLTSPVGVPSAGDHSNQSELIELGHSLSTKNSGLEYAPTPFSCSLPKSPGDVTNGIPLSSPSTLSPMATNFNSTPAQAIDGRHIYRAGSWRLNSLSPNYNGAFGTSGSGSWPVHAQQNVASNSDSPYHHPLGKTVWPDSQLFNNMSASLVQLHGLPRTPSHMLNTASALCHHHLRSAPSVSPSLWDRRLAYAADTTNASEPHLGSLASMGLPGCSRLQPPELASPTIFPHIGGSLISPSISSHIGLPSPQQRCHMSHGRTSMIPTSASFDANDRIRSRRSEANSNQADNKKQYELDIGQIIRGEDSRTTLMIKNIPNKYTSKMLLAAIDEGHRGAYDFIYLPIDFKNKCNVGYAFINMIDPQQIIPFFKTFNGKKWEKFNSEKVVSLAYARIQGKAALIAHFQNSSLMNEDKRCRPILFHTDGPNAGDQEPFPMGINVRSRPGRQRTTSNVDNYQHSPSTSMSGEESSHGTDSSPGSVKDLELTR